MSSKHLMSEKRVKAITTLIEEKLKLLRVQVVSVAQGYTNALFVYGPGGLGKTHHITSALESVAERGWVHHTSYSTPKGLMLALTQHPDSIHLYEDCEKLYKTDVAASILRAACGSPRAKERWVTYETANEKLRVLFRGGIIIVSNEDISRSKGPLSAVASRFRPVEWNLTIEERAATILQIAGHDFKRGGRIVEKEKCQEVARFLIDEMLNGKLATAVDIRTFTEHALPTYAQWQDGKTDAPWQDVLLSKIHGSVTVEERRDEKSLRLQTLALAIDSDKKLTSKSKAAKWKEATGLGQAIYYRHLKAAKATGKGLKKA